MKTIKDETKIVVCPVCQGRGTIEKRINLYESGNVECEYCGGSRVVVEREKITHKRIGDE